LGGAIIGIILSVAAQQALANFFASIIIVIDRPFAVGQYITINSGGLGGEYTGKVLDISFSRTRLKLDDESTVSLPNATLLSGAAVIVKPASKKITKK
jgi:small-conductance mechanosensitive channel